MSSGIAGKQKEPASSAESTPTHHPTPTHRQLKRHPARQTRGPTRCARWDSVVVLPVPVSPTSSTGSRCASAAAQRSMMRSACPVCAKRPRPEGAACVRGSAARDRWMRPTYRGVQGGACRGGSRGTDGWNRAEVFGRCLGLEAGLSIGTFQAPPAAEGPQAQRQLVGAAPPTGRLSPADAAAPAAGTGFRSAAPAPRRRPARHGASQAPHTAQPQSQAAPRARQARRAAAAWRRARRPGR